jgi:hypothetical protein
MFGIWNMQRWMLHLLVVSDSLYLQNSASCIKIIPIFGPKTRFLGHGLLRFEDIENRTPPQNVPSGATYFI